MKKIFTLILSVVFFSHFGNAQFNSTSYPNAQALVQKLLGTGISVSNVTFTGNVDMAAFFTNLGTFTNIGLDSGIILTSGLGRKVQGLPNSGPVGNGSTPAQSTLSSIGWGLPGDPILAAAVGLPVSQLEDACILEFDFVPLGDSIKFDYVFGSEEYEPSFVCTYNDAFGFFISGPGFTGSRNIALVPGTNLPVSIRNINNILNSSPGPCVTNPVFYIDNSTNRYFTYNGHTTVLTAIAEVQPCQVYHLKLVISDVADDIYDTGVFLKAGSLSSNAYQLTNVTQFDPTNGNSYLVEGCVPGSVKISRPLAGGNAQTIALSYGGNAINGVDVQMLPTSVTIPAGQTDAFISINPIIDNITEGIETLIVYTLAPCAGANAVPTDSTKLQIRDYDVLEIIPDSSRICRNAPIQFTAPTSYTTYTWDADTDLNNLTISNPIATPTGSSSTYYCTATIGSCNARDSVFVRVKNIEFLSKIDVNCSQASTGEIRLALGDEWVRPVQFQLGNQPTQLDSVFLNLSVGNYNIKVTDAAGCIDSIQVSINPAYPDLSFTSTIVNATCSGNADGSITVNGTGGLAPYIYQLNNGTFQSSNIFPSRTGKYLVTMKDANNCTYADSVYVDFINDLVLTKGPNETICESKSVQISAGGSADSYAWSPATSLANSNTTTPTASPVVTTTYIVRATKGVCMKTDSVTVNVNLAPIPNAGVDTSVCFGGSIQLMGSGGTQFSWTPGTFLDDATIANPTVRRPTQEIIYTLNTIDANGCASLTSDKMELKVTPAVRIFAGKDTVVAINQPIQLRVYETNNSGVVNWLWTPSYGLNDPNIANPIATLDKDIVYFVTGTTTDQCEGSDSLFVKVYKGPQIYVPTAFTPNRDGRNDLLRAIAIGMKTTKYFTIFNRWGQKIFSTSDFGRGWDGTINGNPQAMGTFVWIAEAIDYTGKTVKVEGSFILLR